MFRHRTSHNCDIKQCLHSVYTITFASSARIQNSSSGERTFVRTDGVRRTKAIVGVCQEKTKYVYDAKDSAKVD